MGAFWRAKFQRPNKKATATVAFCSLSSVTGTVSSFRVANRVGGNGSFLRGFPMWELPRRSMHEVLSGRQESVADERPNYEDLFDWSMSALAIYRRPTCPMP
jgi:hypothetical protein